MIYCNAPPPDRSVCSERCNSGCHLENTTMESQETSQIDCTTSRIQGGASGKVLGVICEDASTFILALMIAFQQVDHDDAAFRESLLESAIQRASKWCSLSLVENAKPLVGQVGGVAQSKKPVLSLEPDYVLKPLLTDHRGVREIAFYEVLSNTKKPQGKQNGASLTVAMNSVSALTDMLDTLAMALAMVFHDHVVLKTEAALDKARQQSRREQVSVSLWQKVLILIVDLRSCCVGLQSLCRSTTALSGRKARKMWPLLLTCYFRMLRCAFGAHV